jgi:hypothetical protein
MPTVLDSTSSDAGAEHQPEEAPASRRRRLRPSPKAIAALLAAGLAVPNLEASFLPNSGAETIMALLETDYENLLASVPTLRALPQAAPTFKALLYLDRTVEQIVPESWATLPGARFPHSPHRYLAQQDDFLKFLTRSDSTGRALLSSSDAVRVYGSALVASRVFHLPPDLLLCLFLQESRLRASAVSATGAEGVGQLTGVAIEHVDDLLDRSQRWRERLKLYERSLTRLYGDTTTQAVLARLVPDLRLPVFRRINRVARAPVSDELLRRVVVLVAHSDPELAADSERLRELCVQLRAGRGVAETSVAKAYHLASMEMYNGQTGNTFNP